MHILIIAQLFNPEMGAGARRMDSIIKELVAAGHRVSVATGMPNYPSGIIAEGYRGRRLMTERLNGATVHRTHYYTIPRNQSKHGQLLTYLTMIPAQFYSGLRAGPVDVIFVTSPPLFSVFPALWLSRLRKAKMVLDLRDLWPDEFVACGVALEKSLVIRLMRRLEQTGYRTASCVVCTTQAFLETVVGRGVPREKTMLGPNGADTEFFRPLPAQNPIAAEYGFGDKFVVLYSGVMGIKHNLDALLEAAKLLKERTDIVFFIRGSGPKRAPLVERVKEEGLKNVVFGQERPLEDVPYLIARADVCVTGLLPDDYLDKIISVKIFEYLACERPIVAALGGESARIIEEADAGIVVPAGRARAIADAILALYADPEGRRRMGERGRRYVAERYSRQATAIQLECRMRALGAPATVTDRKITVDA